MWQSSGHSLALSICHQFPNYSALHNVQRMIKRKSIAVPEQGRYQFTALYVPYHGPAKRRTTDTYRSLWYSCHRISPIIYFKVISANSSWFISRSNSVVMHIVSINGCCVIYSHSSIDWTGTEVNDYGISESSYMQSKDSLGKLNVCCICSFLQIASHSILLQVLVATEQDLVECMPTTLVWWSPNTRWTRLEILVNNVVTMESLLISVYRKKIKSNQPMIKFCHQGG